MAYVLGFILADGCLMKNKRDACFLEMQSTDRDILYKIRREFKSNLIISEYQPKHQNYRKRYRLQIGSKEIFHDILKLGITPRKSKTAILPIIPNQYFHHFLRGYFDGDGNVTITQYKRKDRHNKRSITILSGFTSGSQKLLKQLHLKLKELAKISGGTLYYSNRGYRLYFSVRDSLNLYRFMYKDTGNGLFLSRKKKIFEKFFNLR